jgi:hypothetical protein
MFSVQCGQKQNSGTLTVAALAGFLKNGLFGLLHHQRLEAGVVHK